MNDLVVREDRSRRTAAPSPRYSAVRRRLKAQGCLELSSIHHLAGIGFLRLTNQHKRHTEQPKDESCHRQMIMAFKRNALAIFVARKHARSSVAVSRGRAR